MALLCQKNSYLNNFSTVVKSCKVSDYIVDPKQKIKGYDVILEDTVLFPEGGGQPDDRGKINGEDVLRVTRVGTEAVHVTKNYFEVGQEVQLQVDWSRRWDHMQQHSGQHLISAIAEESPGFPTTSWSLGEKICSIELETTTITKEQINRLEVEVNEKIRAAIPMYPTLYDSVHDPKIDEAHTRGLPADHEGPIRIVTIEGVDVNPCCGTHVSNLAHLQAIKLLGCEKGKKGRVNLLFVVGERVLNYLNTCYEREKIMTSYLKGNPDSHPDLVDKLQKSFKEAHKNEISLLRDVAKMEAQLYKLKPEKPRLFTLHRKEGDLDFMIQFVKEVNDPEALMFLTTGDEKGPGMFILTGNEAIVSKAAPSVMAAIDGKGFCKKGRCQGKANKLNKRMEAGKIILECLQDSGDNNSVTS